MFGICFGNERSFKQFDEKGINILGSIYLREDKHG